MLHLKRLQVATFPLQKDLVDAVITFASIDLRRSAQVSDCFSRFWRPKSLPAVETCRQIQSEVRTWLSEKSAIDPVDAFFGATKERFTDARVEFLGLPGFKAHRVGKELKHEITWQWWVSKGSLRAICGFGVANLYQAGWIDRIGQCAREAYKNDPPCKRFFLDQKSRGQPREYCLTDECNAARLRQRVAAGRPPKRKRK